MCVYSNNARKYVKCASEKHTLFTPASFKTLFSALSARGVSSLTIIIYMYIYHNCLSDIFAMEAEQHLEVGSRKKWYLEMRVISSMRKEGRQWKEEIWWRSGFLIILAAARRENVIAHSISRKCIFMIMRRFPICESGTTLFGRYQPVETWEPFRHPNKTISVVAPGDNPSPVKAKPQPERLCKNSPFL